MNDMTYIVRSEKSFASWIVCYIMAAWAERFKLVIEYNGDNYSHS